MVAADEIPPCDALRVLGAPLAREQTLAELLRRPHLAYSALMSLPGAGPGVDDATVAGQIEIQARYSGYIDRQQQEVTRNQAQEETPLALDLDYTAVRGLSAEVVQKLSQYRPATLGQASRIRHHPRGDFIAARAFEETDFTSRPERLSCVDALALHLDAGLGSLGLDLAVDPRAARIAFLRLLHRWNRVYNLSGVRDPDAMVTRHLLDSLAVLPYLYGERLLDIGSGGDIGHGVGPRGSRSRMVLLDRTQKDRVPAPSAYRARAGARRIVHAVPKTIVPTRLFTAISGPWDRWIGWGAFGHASESPRLATTIPG